MFSYVITTAVIISSFALCDTINEQSKQILQSGNKSITFFILNQHHHLHTQRALQLEKSLIEQSSKVPEVEIVVQLGSLSFPHLPYWTYFPLLEEFQKTESDWYVFINEFSYVNLSKLLQLLELKEGSPFLGRSLRDAEPSALHHYASPSAVPGYPDTRTAIIMSQQAFKTASNTFNSTLHRSQFIIDAGYEFAKWLLTDCDIELEDSPELCVADNAVIDEDYFRETNCVVVAGRQQLCRPGKPVTSADVGLRVAVKTHSGNHGTRLPVLRDTWLSTAHSYTLYSDVTDSAAGTVSSAVPNTERGHCAKLLSIFSLALQTAPSWQWLLIADDDTLVSVGGASAAVSCYDPSTPVVLGEVYGYRASEHRLLPYPTGGSGVLLSRAMVDTVVQSPWCQCRSADEPDDMFLGMCLDRLGHTIVHLADMHQNNPPNYASGRLQKSQPISFHNFWMVTPADVYKQYLNGSKIPEDNQQLRRSFQKKLLRQRRETPSEHKNDKTLPKHEDL